MAQTARTVVIHEFGGPEVLRLEDRPVGEPGPGQVRIRHKACGLNFIDIYQRSGLYPNELPLTMGMEAAGEIEAVGEGVDHLKPGDRAAYAAMPPGAYAEARVMPAAQVCPLPDEIGFDTAAAMMLKGLTVQYLFHRTTPLQRGDSVLFHAAAGGVGLIACQWARSEGITLIGTAGSDEKCKLALDHGAAHCINYRTQDFVAETQALTDGRGADVVLDMVGGDYIGRELKCLADDGRLALIAVQGGVKSEIDAGLVLRKRLTITGSTLRPRPVAYKTELARALRAQVWPLIEAGRVKPVVHTVFPAAEAAAAHALMESSTHVGKMVLTW